ncbi:MAG: hypothetical protein HY272_00640 [Gammaproteobacteria bacterium]|nr:hypothetical protein [Gammaproteobacteria bacterium]
MDANSTSKLFKATLFALLIAVAGCGVDRNAAKYDERRYKELQRASCTEMASLLSSTLIAEKPENYGQAMKRCQDLKTLTYEEYVRYADAARASGNWDIYQHFPGKRTKSQ